MNRSIGWGCTTLLIQGRGRENSLNTVKISKLLDEMARDARAEALRIETTRLEEHRLLLRRKAELAELDSKRKKKRRFWIAGGPAAITRLECI